MILISVILSVWPPRLEPSTNTVWRAIGCSKLTESYCHGMNLLTSNSPTSWSSKIHGSERIALADGSVQQVNSEQLRQLLQNSGLATNRLVLP